MEEVIHCFKVKLTWVFFLGSIHNQARDNPKEQRLYKKLTALNQYHHKNGVDAILSKRVHELRAKVEE